MTYDPIWSHTKLGFLEGYLVIWLSITTKHVASLVNMGIQSDLKETYATIWYITNLGNRQPACSIGKIVGKVVR